jgi:aspartate aminotransferase/aminotransferase
MRDAAEFVSRRALGVDASGIRKVFDLAAKLPDPINLSIGLPDFDVPDAIKAVAIQAIESGMNRYTQTQGIASLRDRLRKDLSAEFGRDVGDVLITSGVSGALLLAMMAIVDPGDEVIFLDPYFVMYRHLLTMTGGKPVAVDSYPDFRFHADRVAAAITPRTKAILLNSPSNPTGIVMSEEEVRAAVEVARAHGLLLVSDEIYEPFLYDMARGLPSAARSYENTLVLRGFSKSHAMTGWRLGYAAGPAAVIEQMAKLQQYTFVCAPSPLQAAAVTAMDVPMDEAVARYRVKRDIICDGLADRFELVRPQGAFYVFPKVPGDRSATDFVSAAIENNVLIIPGNVFSGRDTHFRISYATSDEKLRQGVAVLNSLV